MHKQCERLVGDYIHGGSTANVMELNMVDALLVVMLLLYMSAVWQKASKLCDTVIPPSHVSLKRRIRVRESVR